jgi:high-affinity nickel permease
VLIRNQWLKFRTCRGGVKLWGKSRPMFGILGLGFLLGLQHALEADHIAAVSSIAARRTEMSDIVKHGLTWGLGHTVTLFLIAGAALLLGHALPENCSPPLETAVGIMLVGLGAHVLWRLVHDRVAFSSSQPC